MYIDLTDNIEVNTKVIKIFNRDIALYWAVLVCILKHVKKKNSVDANGFFLLDREYVENRCGLTLEEQLVCDSALMKAGIVEVSEDDINRLGIHVDKMIELIIDDNTRDLKKVAKVAKTTATDQRAAKKAGQIATMQRIACCDLDPAVNEALKAWVEAIYASKTKGFLTKAIIADFLDKLNAYTTSSEVKVELIKIAMNQGWKDMAWAISSYVRSAKLSGKQVELLVDLPQTVEVSQDISF